MLVLTRKQQESVVVGGGGSCPQSLIVTVLAVNGGSVKLGFDAAADIPVYRSEVWDRLRANGAFESKTGMHDLNIERA